MGGNFGGFPHDGDVNMFQNPLMLGQLLQGKAQKKCGIRPLPRGVRGGEMIPNIPQRHGAQHGIG